MLQETRTVIIEKTGYNYSFYHMLAMIDDNINSSVMTSVDYVNDNDINGFIRTFVDGQWLLDKKVRNILLSNGFIIWDSTNPRFNGIIQKTKV